jgi:hypothetical protein
MIKVLEEEQTYYNSIKPELLGKAKGEFVLIKGKQVIDTFKSKADAVKKGYELYGNTPFLIKRIEELEIPQNFTSCLLGV